MITTKYELTNRLDELLVLHNENPDNKNINDLIDYMCNILDYRIFSFGEGLRTIIISTPGNYEIELNEDDYNLIFDREYTKRYTI